MSSVQKGDSEPVNSLENHIRNLKNPQNYLDGLSPEYRYEPERVVFFSRLNTGEFVNNSPVIHHRFNLLFCIKGSLDIHMGNFLFTLREGESLLVFPYQSHYYVCDEEKDLLWLFIGFDMEERRGLGGLKNNPVPITPFVHSCLERMISSEITLTATLIGTILAAHLEEIKGNGRTQPLRIEEGPDTIISRVQHYLYADLSRTITTSDISRELGLSESSLHRGFKRLIGISPGRYIREVKINHACTLLESGKYSITEAALKCGYDSIYSFSRAFKRVTGFSPSHLKHHS